MKTTKWTIKAAILLMALLLPLLQAGAFAQSVDQLKMAGRVTNVNPQSNSIVVRGIQVRADAQTIQGLRSGMIVQVTGTRARDYSIIASQVTQVRAGQTFTAQALILAKNSGARTINFAGLTVSVPTSTKILSVTKKPLTFANLINGAGASISMSAAADGKAVAKQIQLTVPSRVDGNLESTSKSRYWVLMDEGMMFGDSTTQVVSPGNKVMNFKSLTPGQNVSVRVFRQNDGTFYATGVDVVNADNVRLTGIVENWNPANKTFKLQDFTVQWNGATHITSRTAGMIDAVQISNGQFVKVSGVQKGSLSITATSVQVQSPNRIDVRGILQTITPSSVTVDGTTFGVTSSTKIEDRRSLPIQLSDLRAGNVVEVKGVKSADNSLHANQIELQNNVADPDNEDLELNGVVDSKTANSISVSGITIQLVSTTQVRGDISKGRTVEVRARAQGSGWVGIEVKQIDSSSIDNGDDHGHGNDDNGNVNDNGNGNDDNGNGNGNGNDDNGNDNGNGNGNDNGNGNGNGNGNDDNGNGNGNGNGNDNGNGNGNGNGNDNGNGNGNGNGNDNGNGNGNGNFNMFGSF